LQNLNRVAAEAELELGLDSVAADRGLDAV
jgi:hypothetical protein